MNYRVSWIRTVTYGGSTTMDLPADSSDEVILEYLEDNDYTFFEDIEDVYTELADVTPLGNDDDEDDNSD